MKFTSEPDGEGSRRAASKVNCRSYVLVQQTHGIRASKFNVHERRRDASWVR